MRLLRRELRRVQQLLRYRRFSLAGVPVLFANSFPKSGTHLLTQILQGFTRIGPAVNSGLPAIVTFDGFTGQPRPLEAILADLRRLKAGDTAYGHLHALPPIMDYLCRDGFAPFFILRDPRDVVVSHVHYITDMASGHIHHHYFQEVLSTFDERLRASICGMDIESAPSPEIAFPSIAARFEPFLGWLDRPEMLVLHYEAFIRSREDTLQLMLDYVVKRGFPLRRNGDSGCKDANQAAARQDAIEALESSINPAGSPTFRRGKIGGWRDEFSPENKRIFKEIAGDLLIRLGYEKDYDW